MIIRTSNTVWINTDEIKYLRLEPYGKFEDPKVILMGNLGSGEVALTCAITKTLALQMIKEIFRETCVDFTTISWES